MFPILISYQNVIYPINQKYEQFNRNHFADEESVSPPNNENSHSDNSHSGIKEGTYFDIIRFLKSLAA